MIDAGNGIIEFDLSVPITIAKDGKQQPVVNVTFKQPNRKTAPIFENLVSMLSVAQQDFFKVMEKVDPEEAQKAKRKAMEAGKKGEIVDITKEIDTPDEMDIMEEVEGLTSFINGLPFDFEKAYKLFERMLIQEGSFSICSIGQIPFKESWLDQIYYRDYKKMLFLYISFFGKPVKSDTGKDLKPLSGSPMPAVEV